jgi:hypothetical protein
MVLQKAGCPIFRRYVHKLPVLCVPRSHRQSAVNVNFEMERNVEEISEQPPLPATAPEPSYIVPGLGEFLSTNDPHLPTADVSDDEDDDNDVVSGACVLRCAGHEHDWMRGPADAQ